LKLEKNELKRVEKVEESKIMAELQASTEFHGDSMSRDYKGRSYILPPNDVKPHNHVCYIPK